MTVKEIYNFLDEIAPFNTAAQWDNCGLSVGSMDSQVSKILISLDVTSEVIAKAKNIGAELIITHHPLIFNLPNQILKGSLIYEVVNSGLSFIASHTPLDKALGGVNDCLAQKVGIKNTYKSELDEFLKLGEAEPVNADDFARLIKEKLNAKVQYVDSGKIIKKVAFCSGAGGDLYEIAFNEGADALLTGEAKYHQMLDAKHLGISVFSAGHFETENIVCEVLKEKIQNRFNNITVEVFETEAPIKYLS